MDNRKIAMILLKVEMDDLADAEMLADWAKEIEAAGDMGLAGNMRIRAKNRMTQADECKRTFYTVSQRSEPGEMDDFYKDMLEMHLMETHERVRNKLAE